MPIVPAVKVFQLFEASTPIGGVTLDACLIGPNYKVLDYLRADDKQTAFIGLYDSADFETFSYPGRDPGDVVDQDSIQVFFDDLKAELFVGTDGETNSLEPTVLTAGTAGFYFEDFVDKDATLHAKSSLLHSRGAQVGDCVLLSSGAVEHEASILAIESSTDLATIGTPAANSLNHENLLYVDSFNEFGPVTEIAAGGTDALVGVKGVYESFIETLNTYTITVTTPGTLGTSVFNVTDTGSDLPAAGTDFSTTAGVEDYSVGTRGLIVHLEDNGATGLGAAGEWDIVATIPTLSDGAIEKAGSFPSSETSDLEYTITVLDGNNQGLNTITVTTLNSIDNSGPSLVTSGVSFAVGNKGARATINLPSGAKLTPGDSWTMTGRAGGHGDAVTVSGLGTDTFVPLGTYLGTEDSVLRLTNTLGGAFGTATFDWEIYQAGYSDVALNRPLLDSGSITTLVTEDSTTVYSLGLGISITLTDDGGSFTTPKVIESGLFSDYLERPVIDASHDTRADSPEVAVLEAIGGTTNYNFPGAAGGTAPVTGTLTSSGRYLHFEDGTYTLTDLVIGVLGVGTMAVAHSGTDIPLGQVITTEAGVLRYAVGTRGLEIVLSADFETDAAMGVTIACVGVGDMAINTGYAFTSPIVYTVTCTVAGLLAGPAEFDFISTGNVDNGSFTTSAGVTEYTLGTRGIILTLNEGTTGFVLNNTWTVDTTTDSRLASTEDHTYTIEISRTGDYGTAEVFIVSNLGDSTGPFTLNESTDPRRKGESAPFTVGNFGVQARLADGRRTLFPDEAAVYHKGDKWTLATTAEIARGKNRLVLTKSIPTALQDLTGLTYAISLNLDDANIPETGSTNWEADPTTITLSPGIKVTSPDVFDLIGGEPVLFKMTVQSGASAYVTYRALATGLAGTLQSITNVSEIEGQLGRIDPDNPLAFGVFKALENTNTAIKYLRIGTDDDIGYRAAIDILENEADVYALVPLTQDKTVIEDFQQHVNFMSSPDRGLWRIVIVNRALETTSDILINQIDPISGDTVDVEAVFLDDPDATDLTPPVFTRVEDPDATFLSSGVTAGDLLLTNFVNGTPTSSFAVDSVVAEDILILFDGPTAVILSPQKYEIVRTLSKDQQAEAHAAIAESFKDRRVYLTYPDRVIVGEDEVEGFYLSAAIAGLVAGFPPHQGFTNLAMSGFDSVPRSTRYFTREQLNVIALGGTYIITQRTEGGAVFARHQLSTDGASLETQELSITKNLDFLSFYFKGLLEPFIGVYNATGDAVQSIRNVLEGGIEFQRAQALPRIGAPLINAILQKVEVNALLKDTIDIEMDVLLPFPLNFINLRLTVTS